MSIIVSNGNTTLGTTNGFYRAESYNLGVNSNVTLALTIARTISASFDNSGNCKGVVLGLYYSNPTGVASASFRSVTTILQELVGSVWTDRVSKTLTSSEITNTNGWKHGNYYVPFEFPSSYTVDTTASKWRFAVSSSGAGSAPNLMTSNGTLPFYVAWCDSPISFSDGDTVICKDKVIIDRSATFSGSIDFNMGDPTSAMSCLICTNITSSLADDVSLLEWQNPPSASYTLTSDGAIFLPSHAGFRAGSSGSRIPISSSGSLVFVTPTKGSRSGFYNPCIVTSGTAFGSKESLFIYGEIPPVSRTTLVSDVPISGTATMTIASPCVVTKTSHGYSTGHPVSFSTTGALPTGISAGSIYFVSVLTTSTFNLYDTYDNAILGGATGIVNTSGTQSGTHTCNCVLITSDITNWSPGDTIFVGKRTAKGQGDIPNIRTISTVSASYISLVTGIASSPARTSGSVVRSNGYGFNITGYNSANSRCNIGAPSNFIVSGVEIIDFTFNIGVCTYYSTDDSPNRSQFQLNNCTSRATSTGCPMLIAGIKTPPEGIVVDNVHQVRQSLSAFLASSATNVIGSQGRFVMTSGSILGTATNGCFSTANTSKTAITCMGYTWEGAQSTNACPIQLTGVGSIFRNNYVWGANMVDGAVKFGTVINLDAGYNVYENNLIALYFDSFPQVSCLEEFSSYGANVANTTDLDFNAGSFISYEIESPSGNVFVATGSLLNSVPGSIIRITNENGIQNRDKGYLPLGYYKRCGDGLSDTTTRLSGSGNYSMRLQPTDGFDPLNWPNLVSERAIPTGNIQNKTMTVSAWVKINSSNYWAGNYQMPRLNIKYDNRTEIFTTSSKSTDWQLLFLSFTPTTSYGQIEVWFSGASDAFDTDSCFYIDDLSIQYPAGVTLNLGGLDLWVHGTPTWPPIATLATVGQVWDELISTHIGPGTFGELIIRTENKVDDTTALIITK